MPDQLIDSLKQAVFEGTDPARELQPGQSRTRHAWTEANLDIIKIIFLPKNPFSLIFLIFLVPHILPSVSLTIRRLHDTGNSGWWVLLSNGGVAAIIPYAMCLQDSQPEENKYGSNPKLEG